MADRERRQAARAKAEVEVAKAAQALAPAAAAGERKPTGRRQPMKVVVLDDEAAAHLARSLGRERRLGSLTGQAWSAATGELRASTGHDGSALEGTAGAGEDGHVPELLTLAETGDHLRLSLSSVKRLVAGGRLPVVHVGRATRVRPQDLRVFIDGLAEPVRTA